MYVFVHLKVLQCVHRADRKLSTEVATDAKQFDDVELTAQSAQQLKGRVDLVLRRVRFHGETDLVINHWQSPWLELW